MKQFAKFANSFSFRLNHLIRNGRFLMRSRHDEKDGEKLEEVHCCVLRDTFRCRMIRGWAVANDFIRPCPHRPPQGPRTTRPASPRFQRVPLPV
ncbi:unnamed protein product [Nesidiocoris tenuis]|uniref:Uncharacterized protein n=1 Tax=Nesidiocoris tenuis TaxID=355587 RepID=A0A6H5GI62_9HEMI|nr:unnamed protein product [Nesidiocoris tenuis]